MPNMWGREKRSMTDRMQQGATAIGVPLDIYEARLEAGERWCAHHKTWHPSGEFSRGTTSYGVARFRSICRLADRERYHEKKANRLAQQGA
jgi:hypothetical protein